MLIQLTYLNVNCYSLERSCRRSIEFPNFHGPTFETFFYRKLFYRNYCKWTILIKNKIYILQIHWSFVKYVKYDKEYIIRLCNSCKNCRWICKFLKILRFYSLKLNYIFPESWMVYYRVNKQKIITRGVTRAISLEMASNK